MNYLWVFYAQSSGNFLIFFWKLLKVYEKMSKIKWKIMTKSLKTCPGKNRENWEEFREFPGKNIAISREFPGREIPAVNPNWDSRTVKKSRFLDDVVYGWSLTEIHCKIWILKLKSFNFSLFTIPLYWKRSSG